MGFGIKELIIILIIVLLLFGTKRLKTLGTDLGSAIKGFRKSVNDDDNQNNTDNTDESASAENEPLLPASEKKSSEL